ncbi:MAG: universal stress protein [Chitinophagaceae bacterium]
MSTKFNTILVPVDFTINTDVAIKRATDLCDGNNATIHLLHVPKMSTASIISYYQYFARYTRIGPEFDYSKLTTKLEKLKQKITAIRKDIIVSAWVSDGPTVEMVIAEKADRLGADLIIIGKNSNHSWVPFLNTVVPSRLSKKTGRPVLTVKPGSANQDIKMVVVPVDEKFYENKLAIIQELRKKNRFHIRLIACLNSNDKKEAASASLVRAFRILKANTVNNVSYEIIRAENKPRAIAKYCNRVEADLLIVNPESETRIGWFNTHISDILPKESRTQVLSVLPASV